MNSTRPPHFHPIRSLFASDTEPLHDLPAATIQQINEASRKYYEDPARYEYWRNKPFSDPRWAPWFLSRFGLLLSAFRLRSGERVLDFGCGTGWTSIMLAQMGAEVLALDVADAALQIGRDNAKRVLTEEQFARIRFERYSGDEISAESGTFDFVMVFEALHHLPNPQRILKEFSRVLHEYGLFGFAEPGLGHADTHSSVEEAAHGILEEDLDLERLYKTAIACGFQDLDVLIPALSPDTLTLPMERVRWFLRGMSWLLPANFLRSAILNSPVGVFRKSKYPITSVHPKGHHALIRPMQRQISVMPSSDFAIQVEVENPTDTVWLRKGVQGRGYVRVGAHLLASDGSMKQFEFGRSELPHDLGQDDRVQVVVNLRAPQQQGEYVVRLDLVNEGICWFEEEGSQTADVGLSVGVGG